MIRPSQSLFTAIAALTVFACQAEELEDADRFRVINGAPAPSSSPEYAATVAMHSRSGDTINPFPYCSGTLIGADVVLTAADAALLYNHATQDWRDLIPRLALPTLVVGGRVSTVPWRSQAWVAAQVPGARLEIFEEEEGGNHFMFIEGHAKFNAIVADFVG